MVKLLGDLIAFALIAVIFAGGLDLLFRLSAQSWLYLLAAGVGMLGLLGLGALYLRWHDARRRAAGLDRAKARIAGLVANHIRVLGNKRDTLLRSDAYGVPETEDWDREMAYFCNRVVLPALAEDEAEALHHAGVTEVLHDILERAVSEYCATRDLPDTLPKRISPAEFEGRCAAILRRHGWQATTTGGSGDQGADVLAEREGLRLVLQCKLYSKPVGNKAVQEVAAAKQFYHADLAAVVSNSSYTRAATTLAGASAVELLHFGELSRFADEVQARGRGASRAAGRQRGRRP